VGGWMDELIKNELLNKQINKCKNMPLKKITTVRVGRNKKNI
jgi:hypothetical protein